jgi:hypothetical protein
MHGYNEDDGIVQSQLSMWLTEIVEDIGMLLNS